MTTERNNNLNLTERFPDVEWKLITIKLLHIAASADQTTSFAALIIAFKPAAY